METKNTFAIGIPTLNRIDLLLPTLMLYAIDFPNTPIFIYDNGQQFIEDKLRGIRNLRGCKRAYEALSNVKVISLGTGKNVGVAAAWNVLCFEAFINHTHILMLNDDIYLGKTEQEINSMINNDFAPQFDFFGCERGLDWSAFMLPRSTYWKVGEFDTNFYPAYYEDRDYDYRMQIHGLDIHYKPYLNPVVFRRSMTLMKEPTLMDTHRMKNKLYYEKKWGGEVGVEKFTIPFNATT